MRKNEAQAALVRRQALGYGVLSTVHSVLEIARRVRTGKPLTQLLVTIVLGWIVVGAAAARSLRRNDVIFPWLFYRALLAFTAFLAAVAAYHVVRGD